MARIRKKQRKLKKQGNSCIKEKQLLQEISQLSSLEEMVSILEEYLLYNKPCIKKSINTNIHG